MADSKKQGVNAVGKNINIVTTINEATSEKQIVLTEEIYKEILDDKVKIRTFELNAAHGEEKARLQKEIDDLKNLLANLPQAFEEAQIQIAKLKAKLEREGNEIGAEKLAVAIIALEQADFSKADELFAEIEIREKLAVKRSARAAFARGEIAQQEVRWHDAAEHYTRAAQLDPCFDTLIRAQQLTQDSGNYVSALSLGLAAEKAAIAEYGEESKEHANCLNNIAGVYQRQRRDKEAEKLYEQVIKINKELLGEDHPNTATSLDNLAVIYSNQGFYEKSESFHKQALDIRKKTLGENHPDTAKGLNNLAGTYHDQGLYQKAEIVYQQSLNILKKIFGERHPSVATSLNNLGAICHVQEKYKEAEAFHKESLEIYTELLGDKHPHTARSLGNLGEVYKKQENYEKAELFHSKALKIYQEVLGINHPNTATNLNNLGGVYQGQKNYEKANSFYKEALNIRKKNLEENHPDIANSFNNLAALYQETGQYDEAESFCKQALRIFEATLGHEHPITKLVRTNCERIKENANIPPQ